MSEEKLRIHTRVSQEMGRKIETAMVKANCQSRNEFLEAALQFYCYYQAAEDVADFLPPIFVHAMRGTIQCSEDRIARLLFKLTVEISIDERAGGWAGDRRQPAGRPALALCAGGKKDQRQYHLQGHTGKNQDE